MGSSDKISTSSRSERIFKDFEARWQPRSKVDFEYFLNLAEPTMRDQALQRLLEIDFALRVKSGQTITLANYRHLGSGPVEVIERLLLEQAYHSDATVDLAEKKTLNKKDLETGLESLSTQGFGYVPIESAELPEQIGRYRIEKILGKGGFGIVYLARDDQLTRRVAIKIPHTTLVSEPCDAEVYLNEARTVANLDHPNIVPVYDVGMSDEYPCYIVSRYVEGVDLRQKIERQHLELNQAARIVATIAEALHFAHRQGIVHRDVKPGNILLDTEGNPYVVDFGLALSERDIGQTPSYAGTPAYMSPEQARGEGHRVDGRSDIYSLGAVLYELMTGRRTINSANVMQLLKQISNQDVKPPRQIVDSIPKELERICLKALALRASDRYTTALDMAEDLKCFLAQHPVISTSNARNVASNNLPSANTIQFYTGSDTEKFDSNSQIIRIVPKGLRSFDSNDADFFLELLPGPRDREGLPDSLRFWKTRVEETDADNTFSVGLIYGPSGCGKSSLVKAGLLPRLSDNLFPVYIEATPEETESRLLHGLRKRCPTLDNSLTLTETLTSLRRGQGLPIAGKILIVLDQFEQWLHAKNEKLSTELVQALRQCDGGRVQCIILVRDDFWMSVTRFLHELEIKLIEGHNLAAVDLFPERHAQKVLKAFGQAFGALPDSDKSMNHEHQEFLTQAVDGLAEEGKVICVRLALFAEMMKGKPWTVAKLNEVGGTQGIGVTFLEETFSSSAASPEHRYYQAPARAVLKALLPVSGTNIKGQMKSASEMMESSGLANRPKDFDELIRILDREVRLITPTDRDGGELVLNSASQIENGQQYYQLTHDYLVPSLQDWLTDKQKESRHGRAELCLAERSALWNAKPENRHLPSWWESLQVRLFTHHRKWTEPQRNMMRQATWAHGFQMFTGLLLAGLFLLVIYLMAEKSILVFDNQNRDIAARKQAFDNLNLSDDETLKSIQRTFETEVDIELIQYVISEKRFRQRAKELADSRSEQGAGRAAFRQLILNIVKRKPTPSTRESSSSLDEVRANAFELLCDLSTPVEIVKIISSEVRDNESSRRTNEMLFTYISELKTIDTIGEVDLLVDLITGETPIGLKIASLNAWGKLSKEDLQTSLEKLPKDSLENFFSWITRTMNKDPDPERKLGPKAVAFLDQIEPSTLVDYFYDFSTQEGSKGVFKLSLLPYERLTSPLRIKEIGDELETRFIAAVNSASKDKGELYDPTEKFEYFVLGIGIGEQPRDKSRQIVSKILCQRKQAEDDLLLDSVISTFARMQRRTNLENTDGLSKIHEILGDTKTHVDNRMAAIEAIGTLNDQTGFPILLRIVQQKQNPIDLREMAMETLQTLIESSTDISAEKSSVMPVLTDILSSAVDDARVRRTAILIYGQIAEPDEILGISPQLQSLELPTIDAFHNVIFNGGDDAGATVKHLLPFLTTYNQGDTNLSPTRFLVFVDFPGRYVGNEGKMEQAAKSMIIALANAVANSDDFAERELAAKCLEKYLVKFEPRPPTLIDPSANLKDRKSQLKDWTNSWNQNENRTTFRFSDSQ